jgi:hypothetical protein
MYNDTYLLKKLPAILLSVVFSVFLFSTELTAQTTLGVTGLLNSPSATMSEDGTVKIGGNFLNTNMTPNTWNYNTFNYFVNITFLPFFEVALTNTAFKLGGSENFNNVDRAISVRLRVLKEHKYLPSVVVGSNDLLTSNRENYFSPTKGNKYFGMNYVAASKHVIFNENKLGFHAAYNILSSKKQTLDNPISGGITFTPSFARDLAAEYDTRDFNLGGSYLLFKTFYIQAFVQEFKYLSFGGHFIISLL